jgi:hypothetical protein
MHFFKNMTVWQLVCKDCPYSWCTVRRIITQYECPRANRILRVNLCEKQSSHNFKQFLQCQFPLRVASPSQHTAAESNNASKQESNETEQKKVVFVIYLNVFVTGSDVS